MSSRAKTSNARSSSPMRKSLPQRPATTFAPYRPRKQFFPVVSTFGKDAPKITIGCSRPEPLIPFIGPGPGAYDQPVDSHNRKILPRFPREVSKPADSPTQGVEFINHPFFPEKKAITIGNVDKHPFYYCIDSPGPSYVPRSSLSPQTHRISDRLPLTPRDRKTGPEPASYNPMDPSMRKAPLYSLSGPKHRDDWMVDKQNLPGPGSYSPLRQDRLRSLPIGRKSLKSRNREKGPLVGFDYFSIRLSPDGADANLRYIGNHPELKFLLRDFGEEVMKEKPEDTIEFIIDYFNDLKLIMRAEQETVTQE